MSLGANEPLPVEFFRSGEARRFAVQVVGQVEQNRILLLSVPDVLKAADAETVGGLAPSGFVPAAPPSGGMEALQVAPWALALDSLLAPVVRWLSRAPAPRTFFRGGQHHAGEPGLVPDWQQG